MGHRRCSHLGLDTAPILLLSGSCRNYITPQHPGSGAFNAQPRERPAVPGIPRTRVIRAQAPAACLF